MTRAFHSVLSGAMNVVRNQRGVEAVYRRSGTFEVPLTVVAASTRMEADEGDGLTVDVRKRDWLVRASDLRAGDQAITPAVGDLIVVTLPGGPQETWQVVPISGEKHYRAMDESGRELRIHSQLVNSEDL